MRPVIPMLCSFSILSLPATNSTLQAQTLIRGTVRADSTMTAIHGAFVMLMGADGSAVASAVSGSDGRFLLHAEPGRFLLHVRRVGYSPTVTPEFEVPAAGTEVELTVLLPQDALVLDTLSVEGEAERFAPGPMRGFYERKRLGLGLFLTREEWKERTPTRITDILRGLPGVRIIHVANGGYAVEMARTPKRMRITSLSGMGGGGRKEANCPVSYYLDGIKFVPTERGINELALPSDIEAIEVYRGPSETPGEFLNTNDLGCGAVAIWTRRAPRPEKKKKKGSGS